MKGVMSLREVLRKEKKFLLNYLELYKMKGFLEKVMIHDPHNIGEGYMVRSLYFDTLDNVCFHEKMDGVNKRKKVRLRVYALDSTVAYLEIKQKDGENQQKRSLELSRSDAEELIKCNYEVLLKYRGLFAQECYSLLKSENYKPKVIVEYKRLAYIAKENSVRITFDSDIRATECNFNIFDSNLLLYPVFSKDTLVFEVKFNGFLLSYVQNFISMVEKEELSISKYCLARGVSLSYVY